MQKTSRRGEPATSSKPHYQRRRKAEGLIKSNGAQNKKGGTGPKEQGGDDRYNQFSVISERIPAGGTRIDCGADQCAQHHRPTERKGISQRHEKKKKDRKTGRSQPAPTERFFELNEAPGDQGGAKEVGRLLRRRRGFCGPLARARGHVGAVKRENWNRKHLRSI